MEIEDINAFSETAKLESISKAALSLHLTQPTLSKKIKRLERELGFDLFERNHSGVKLTTAGKMFLHYTTKAMEQILEGTERARAASNEKILKIAAPAAFSDSIFPKIIPFLEKEKILYEFYHHHSRDIPELIHDQALDIGILETVTLQSHLTSEHLYDDPIVLCASTEHKFSSKHSIDFLQIKNEKLALFSWGKDFELLLNLLSKHTIPSNNFRNISPASVVKELIIKNNYIAFLPYSSVIKDVKKNRIKIVEVKETEKWHYSLSVVYRSTLLDRADAHQTINIIKAVDWC